MKRGHAHGATDDFGYNIVENPVHAHDLQAIILHLLGINHEQLTYRHAGRDYRLTDVAGKVVQDSVTYLFAASAASATSCTPSAKRSTHHGEWSGTQRIGEWSRTA